MAKRMKHSYWAQKPPVFQANSFWKKENVDRVEHNQEIGMNTTQVTSLHVRPFPSGAAVWQKKLSWSKPQKYLYLLFSLPDTGPNMVFPE